MRNPNKGQGPNAEVIAKVSKSWLKSQTIHIRVATICGRNP